MSRTSVTIKSLKGLAKVCNPHNSSLDYLKSRAFLKNLTTATERSYFQNPNGFDGENCLEYQQNSSNNYVEFQQKSSGYIKENLENPDASCRGSPAVVRQNPSRVYGLNNRNEFQQDLAGQNGNNFSYSQIPGNEGHHYPVGKNMNSESGYHGGCCRTDFQQNPVGENGKVSSGYTRESPKIKYQQNVGVQNLKFNGYYEQNAQQLWQNSSGNNMESLGNLQKSVDAVGIQKSLNGFYGQRSLEATGSVNGNYGEVSMQDHQQSSGDMGNNQTSQHSSYNYYTGRGGNSQQVPGINYGGNDGIYQPSPGAYHGDNDARSNVFLKENVGVYPQIPGGNHNPNAGLQHIPNVYQTGMVGPHTSSGSTYNGELVEAAESSQLTGTVEELDGFCKEGKLKEAAEVLGLLEQQRIPVDMPRYLNLMRACGEAKDLDEAKNVHHHLMRSVSHLEVRTCNKILEMYCRCGSMSDAYEVFNKMPQRNLTSWDTMIMWLAKNGHGEEAIEMFTRFKESGLRPDGQMFYSVFSACSVLGDVTEGMLHFESMSKNYFIVPSMEHYVSIVDMLGSTGYLDEALEFVEKMPVEPSIDVWETLMNFSRVHGNVELGDHCAELIEILDPSRLSETSKAGLIPVKASDIAKEKEKKLAGRNLLEIRSKVYEYRAGDRSHPDNDKIYALLQGMRQQMKEAGYIPETKFVLHDIDQEGKEDALLAHSERLAVSQALMSSPARSPIRVMKNLRVCGDCHSALKIISKLVGRELIMRDAKRFHHFKDGFCSCRDYW